MPDGQQDQRRADKHTELAIELHASERRYDIVEISVVPYGPPDGAAAMSPTPTLRIDAILDACNLLQHDLNTRRPIPLPISRHIDRLFTHPSNLHHTAYQMQTTRHEHLDFPLILLTTHNPYRMLDAGDDVNSILAERRYELHPSIGELMLRRKRR